MNNTKKTIVSDFLEFAGEANLRSTVDIRDGLKPVHRRIMYELSTMKKGSFIGSATVVGTVLGKWHPHGDQSVYDAAIRLAQPFKSRYPLIEVDGNKGTLAQPMGFAAMRYTKMQLSPLGVEALKDIKKDTVTMSENFDGSLLEPDFLPGSVPVTLMNGTVGIGVGMASSIPPHNLREISGAVSHLIDNPDATTKDLMRFIKGPDFPTGGTIINPEALLDAYETGSGSARVRADYEVTTVKGKTHIIIKEVPFLVDPVSKIIEPLQELYAEGYEYIEDIEIQTGKGIPFQLDIQLSSNAPVFSVIETLLKETSIESSFTINLTTYSGNRKFAKHGIKSLLEQYIEQNKDRNVKAARFDIHKAEARKIIVEALIKAIASIEDVIKIIKGSSSVPQAKIELGKLLDINELQATSILAMRLSQLTKLDARKLQSEYKELVEFIKNLTDFLSDTDAQLEKVRDDLKEIALKYGDARRTLIREETDLSEAKDVTVFLSKDNCIFAQPSDVLPENRRNTKGKKSEEIISLVETKSNGVVLIASSTGMIYPVRVASLTISDDVIKNTVENFGVSGQAVQVLKPLNKDNLITVTKEGTVKRSSLSDYNKNSSFRACKVRDGDALDKVFLLNDDESIVMLLDSGKYVYFGVDEINSTGTNTIGTKLSPNKVLGVVPGDEFIIFVDSESTGKSVLITDLKSSARKSSGISSNDSVHIASAKRGDSVYIFSGDDDKMIRIPLKSVSKSSTANSKGVILYNGTIGKILTK